MNICTDFEKPTDRPAFGIDSAQRPAPATSSIVYARANTYDKFYADARPTNQVQSANSVAKAKPKLRDYGGKKDGKLMVGCQDFYTSISGVYAKKECDCLTVTEEELMKMDVRYDYEDLNCAVADILKSKKCGSSAGCDRKRRQRLTQEQQDILEHEFQKQPDWGVLKMMQISRRLGLQKGKIYKWNWDRKKKDKAYSQTSFQITRVPKIVMSSTGGQALYSAASSSKDEVPQPIFTTSKRIEINRNVSTVQKQTGSSMQEIDEEEEEKDPFTETFSDEDDLDSSG